LPYGSTETNPKGRAHSDAGEKEARGSLFSRADSLGVGGRKTGKYAPRHSQQFHACGGGLSVTADAGVSDNAKLETVEEGVELEARAAVESQTSLRLAPYRCRVSVCLFGGGTLPSAVLRAGVGIAL